MPEIFTNEREEFLAHFPVSPETLLRLERYAALLCEWNQKFNLIAGSTEPHIWRRHFLDCAQLIKFIPPESIVADLGSGAGLPGIVLSILGAKLHLIESTGKKANFLNLVVQELKLDAKVQQMRIESLHNLRVDVIVARALKPLPDLMKLAKPLMRKGSFLLSLKGQQIDAELTDSTKYWRFTYEKFPSLSDPSGTVLKISELALYDKTKYGRLAKR